ncbi:hypothetical protein [Nocardia farcinica]|uniref:hypothetical protein n=1 Tax=Nocardia farcinica TaxID=37329 RepID=UPI002458DCC2|nr:hypothetical protein [Nocardia farcinica]
MNETDPLLQFAIDNRDWLGYLAMHGGELGITVARALYGLAEPLLRQFFLEYPH